MHILVLRTVPNSQLALSIGVDEQGRTDLSVFFFFYFIKRLDQHRSKLLEIEVKFLLVPENPEHILIRLKHPRKERVTIGIDLNPYFGDIRLVVHSVDLDVDQLVAAEVLGVALVVDVFHLGGSLVVEEQRVAAFYCGAFYGGGGVERGGLVHFVWRILLGLVAQLLFSLTNV